MSEESSGARFPVLNVLIEDRLNLSAEENREPNIDWLSMYGGSPRVALSGGVFFDLFPAPVERTGPGDAARPCGHALGEGLVRVNVPFARAEAILRKYSSRPSPATIPAAGCGTARTVPATPGP